MDEAGNLDNSPESDIASQNGMSDPVSGPPRLNRRCQTNAPRSSAKNEACYLAIRYT